MYVCMYIGAVNGYTGKELNYSNVTYDAVAAPYIQYTRPSPESNVVSYLQYTEEILHC